MTDAFRPFEHVRAFKRTTRARFPLNGSAVAETTAAEVLGDDGAPRIEGSSIADCVAAWREAVAARYGVPTTEVAPALAASGGVFLALTALCTKIPRGAAVAVERPAYGVFESCAAFLGREVLHVERRAETGWALDLDAVDDAFVAGARAFCVTDLHNPTGVALTADEAASLAEIARRRDGWVLVDEVYRDFRPGPVGTARRPDSRVVAVGSLTKCYGLGGLRAGWIFGPPEIVERAEQVEEIAYGLPPAPTFDLGVRALRRADEILARGRAAAAAGRAVMDAWIASTPHVSWVPPTAGLTGLVRVEGLRDSVRFAARLREELDVQVIAGAWFGAEGHVRVSFGLPPRDLAAALDVLALGIPPLRDT